MCSTVHIKEYLREKGPLILDGGLATDLEANGAHLQGDPLWSARLLYSNPQALKDAHRRFLLSGVDVITTATYQATIPGFIRHLNVDSDRARELVMSGVYIAKEAIDTIETAQICPLVAGSVGSFGAYLHDGSEYTGTFAQEKSVEELLEWHRPNVSCLLTAGADFLAFETIPSIKEAEAVVKLLREFPNSNAWLSFTCKDEKHISDGSLFSDAVQIASRCPQLLAVGVNCCSPAVVETQLDSAKAELRPDMTWVVYPNSGEEWDKVQGWKPSANIKVWSPKLTQKWLRQGASLIGGCCRVGPAQIEELRQHLKGEISAEES